MRSVPRYENLNTGGNILIGFGKRVPGGRKEIGELSYVGESDKATAHGAFKDPDDFRHTPVRQNRIASPRLVPLIVFCMDRAGKFFLAALMRDMLELICGIRDATQLSCQ